MGISRIWDGSFPLGVQLALEERPRPGALGSSPSSGEECA